MTKAQALTILEELDEDEFQRWFTSLPQRVQMIVKARFVDWREILPEWYIKGQTE